MKDLTPREMSSLKGGQPFNIAALASAGNVALAIPIAVNVSGDQTANQNGAFASAGNQSFTDIDQSN